MRPHGLDFSFSTRAANDRIALWTPGSRIRAILNLWLYLYRTKKVFEFSFVTLSVTQSEHSEPVLENYIKFWEQIALQVNCELPALDH